MHNIVFISEKIILYLELKKIELRLWYIKWQDWKYTLSITVKISDITVHWVQRLAVMDCTQVS